MAALLSPQHGQGGDWALLAATLAPDSVKLCLRGVKAESDGSEHRHIPLASTHMHSCMHTRICTCERTHTHHVQTHHTQIHNTHMHGPHTKKIKQRGGNAKCGSRWRALGVYPITLSFCTLVNFTINSWKRFLIGKAIKNIKPLRTEHPIIFLKKKKKQN